MFGPGDPVPSFTVRGLRNPRYSFDLAAGRYLVLSFVGSRRQPGVAAFHAKLHDDRMHFDDSFASMFIVSNDPRDESEGRFKERYPGVRIFLDDDCAVARMFGVWHAGEDGRGRIRLTSWILDPGLRVLKVVANENLEFHYEAICAALAGLASPEQDMESWAPVLRVPHVLEPELCRELIAYCEAEGVEESGYMKTDPATGKTISVLDRNHKRRSDCTIEDESLREALRDRVRRRLNPQIERVFQFKVTRMERYIVACYDAGAGGHFRAHRDNTTLGTAHRRFAVSIGLTPRATKAATCASPNSAGAPTAGRPEGRSCFPPRCCTR